MTLDLARVIDQISAMVATVDRSHERERFEALRGAWSNLNGAEVNRRARAAKTSFLHAGGVHDYRARFPLPPLPDSYRVIATDGSMIVPDRHSPARYYLLNTGKVRLDYGASPGAVMSATPDLRYGEDELFVTGDTRRVPVTDVILGLKRATLELAAALDLVDNSGPPAVALVDGSLILWSMESLDEAIKRELLDDFLAALRRLREQEVPTAGYISSPGATDLLGTLRIAVCDYPPERAIDCNNCWSRMVNESHTPACEILPRVTDRYILSEVEGLQPGERTSVFPSQSRILQLYGDDFAVEFFYVNTSSEIARIEIPRWVARRPDLLDRVHAVVHNQAMLGRGYPVALQEAHEQAVLSVGDRRLIEESIERLLGRAGVVVNRTGKDGSKRGRFV